MDNGTNLQLMNTIDLVNAAVRAWLGHTRLTQAEAAELLGVALPTMKSKLHGSRPWKVAEIDRLVELGVLEPIKAKETAA